jgi:hypothetical protein
MAAVLAIAGAAIFYGIERNRGVSVPLGYTTPSETSRPQIDGAALERMRPYVGMSVQGMSIVTGKPFVMELDAGGVAEVKVEIATAGQFIDDRGSWWIADNGDFCVHYTRFAGGNVACRKVVVENGVVKAYTWDHRPNVWVLKK